MKMLYCPPPPPPPPHSHTHTCTHAHTHTHTYTHTRTHAHTQDPVINVRLRLSRILPDIKAILKLPRDRKLLQLLELTVRKLISQERDPDASEAIREAITELDRIEVAMETVGSSNRCLLELHCFYSCLLCKLVAGITHLSRCSVSLRRHTSCTVLMVILHTWHS